MKADVESLLAPISAENSCGEDIKNDPEFLEVEAMLRGKQGAHAPAEEPDWREVTKRCVALFQRSKDLRVVLWLTLGLLKTEGISGFREGLLLLKGLIQRFWEPFHPRLDPDDNNDPLQRVNILASLAAPRGAFGDRLQFLTRLRQVPLTDSPQIGRLSMVDIERSAAGMADPNGTVISAAQVQAAFRDTSQEKIRETYDAIVVSQQTVQEIDALLANAVGTTRAADFGPLTSTLKEMQKTLAPYAAPGESVDTPSGQSSATAVEKSLEEPVEISGAVRSGQDVIRVLDQICDFYHRTEPSSPIPLLLRRARRLVNMDFMQVLTDLAPGSLDEIKKIAGTREESAEGQQ